MCLVNFSSAAQDANSREEMTDVTTQKQADIVLDPFCGSGTTCVAAATLGRRYVGIDVNQEAIKITSERLAKIDAARQIMTADENVAEALEQGTGVLIHGDCLDVLPKLIDQGIKIDLIYMDPPFFSQKDYKDKSGKVQFTDKFTSMDAYIAWIEERVRLCHQILK